MLKLNTIHDRLQDAQRLEKLEAGFFEPSEARAAP
jgi:hypothetical protein